MEVVNTIGRRKSAVARIYLYEGKGNITINNRDYKEYFPIINLQYIVTQPLNIAEAADKYDIKVNLNGGRIKGQAEAFLLAISRALLKIDKDLKKDLKAEGLLTRDPREVERKKPGRPKARKRFQFS